MALTQQTIDYWNQGAKRPPARFVNVAPSNSYWKTDKTPVERWMALTSRKSKRCVSPFKGVQLNSGPAAKDKPWRAMLVFQGRRYYGGAFVTEEEAALKWNELVLKHIGHEAESVLNILPGETT